MINPPKLLYTYALRYDPESYLRNDYYAEKMRAAARTMDSTGPFWWLFFRKIIPSRSSVLFDPPKIPPRRDETLHVHVDNTHDEIDVEHGRELADNNSTHSTDDEDWKTAEGD